MKLKHILAAWSLTAVGVVVAQPSANYTSFLAEVASRSPQWTAAERNLNATTRNLRTGLTPNDPQVYLEYQFSQEATYEISIEQAFDFPTVYHQRNRLSKLGISRATQGHLAAQRGLMAEVSDNYLRLTYASARVDLLTRRKEGLVHLVELYKEGGFAGHNTAVELESARMLLSDVRHTLILTEAERDEAAAGLAQLNGGETIAPQGYPLFRFSGTREEFIRAALSIDHELQAAALDTLIARHELKLSRNEWIPKLVVGYKALVEGSRASNVLLAGISLPLWQNSGRTRYAKALEEAAEAQHLATESSARTRLGTLYSRYQALAMALDQDDHEGPDSSYPALVKQALDAGRLSSLEFFISLDEWYEMTGSHIELEYEAAQAGALMAICLM